MGTSCLMHCGRVVSVNPKQTWEDTVVGLFYCKKLFRLKLVSWLSLQMYKKGTASWEQSSHFGNVMSPACWVGSFLAIKAQIGAYYVWWRHTMSSGRCSVFLHSAARCVLLLENSLQLTVVSLPLGCPKNRNMPNRFQTSFWLVILLRFGSVCGFGFSTNKSEFRTWSSIKFRIFLQAN